MNDGVYTVSEKELIEEILNENTHRTWLAMFEDDTGMNISLQLDGLILNKRKFVIYFQGRSWHIKKCRDEETCLNINLANYAMVKGWPVTIEQYNFATTPEIIQRQPEIRIFDRDNNICRRFRFQFMDIVENITTHRFLVPSGPLIEEPIQNRGGRRYSGALDDCVGFATGRFQNIFEREDNIMITNNINDITIRTNGKLIIDADGISFERAYSDTKDEIISTAQMIDIYGTDIARRIWNYIDKPAKSTAEMIVKEQIKKILIEGDEE